MGKSSYAFFRFSILDSADQPLAINKYSKFLRDCSGIQVPHRKSDPKPSDNDTFVMRVRDKKIDGAPYIIFDVARTIHQRMENRYNKNADELNQHAVNANDTQWTHAVMVPVVGIVAIKDGSGENLSADAGAGRLRSVVRHLKNCDLQFERTATAHDVDKALRSLSLTAFSFTARPFNPHPSIPGEQMDALMKKAGIGRITAKAEPAVGHTMTAADEGLISEAMGLAQKGYGQVGFKGVTSTGAEVAYKKPKMENTREANLRQQTQTTLKIVVPDNDEAMTEEEYVVKTILELYNENESES